MCLGLRVHDDAGASGIKHHQASVLVLVCIFMLSLSRSSDCRSTANSKAHKTEEAITMRSKEEIWSKFGDSYKGDESKSTKYCRCSACSEPVIAACGRLRDHWAKCPKRARGIGQLDAGFVPSRKKYYQSREQRQTPSRQHSVASTTNTVASASQAGLGAFSPSGDTVDDQVVHSSFFSGGRQHFDTLKPHEQEKLNVLFARAVHRTATPFSAFEHPAWKAFFRSLRGCYILPTREAIGGHLMTSEYTETMNEVILDLGKHSLICFTLDGATNVQGKQVINMMACGPKAYFLEHFTMQLRRESASNLLEKLLDCKLRLFASIRPPAPGYSLSRDVQLIETGDAIAAEIAAENHQQAPDGSITATKNEHFIGAPIFTFCSDSPSVMVKLRKDCLATNEFVFAYGCAPHAIHNLCMDLIKHFPAVTLVLKQILYMVKTLKASHILLQLFDKLCMEKYKKTYVLILFTKTRWGTVFFAAQRANRVKAACAALPSEILNSDLDIDIPDKLKQLLTDPLYWKGVAALETLFMTISSCLSYLEGDEATFSAVYACFVAIKYHLKTLDAIFKDGFNLNDDDIQQMMMLTHHRFSTIYTEAHGLAFTTDPMFTEMQSTIATEFGEEFLQLDKNSLNQQSKIALARLARGNDDLRRRMFSEFATFIMRCKDNDKDFDFGDIMMKPSELWALCDDSCYGSIKHALSALHRNPPGASGGERNHKSAKHVHSRLRARLGQAKIETGTAILFNAKQLQRKMSVTRDTRFCKWLCRLGMAGNNHGLDAAANELEDLLAVNQEGQVDDHLILDVDEDEVNGTDEFDQIDLSGGIDTIVDELLFVCGEELDEVNAGPP